MPTAVLAETLRQPLGSVGTFDYAWRLDFALLHSNATDVGCAAGEASWDPEDAGHGDEWKGMTGRFLDWDTQFRDATMNSISNMSVEYLSRRALQACIQAAAVRCEIKCKRSRSWCQQNRACGWLSLTRTSWLALFCTACTRVVSVQSDGSPPMGKGLGKPERVN
eukprot:2483250-Rhodomonas_salina.1